MGIKELHVLLFKAQRARILEVEKLNTLRKFFAALILLNLVIFFCAPVQANAQTGTLGSEEPYLYCTYYNANGDAVDGNALTSGNYRVDIVISGMQTAAIMQITADVNASSASALKSLSVTSTYDETDSSFSLAAAEYITDSSLSVILTSKNTETCSQINSEGTVIASLSANIDCDGTIDFNDYFNFETDSDLTFFEADYGDGDDCYALSQGVDVAYTVYPMTADVTPEINNGKIIIQGRILVADSADGNARNKFIISGVNIVDINGNILATTADDGTFTAEVDKGTTSIKITGQSTIDRTVYLTGNSDISNVEIPIVICDYNRTGSVDATDLGLFKKKLGIYDVNYDLNNSKNVDSTDLGIFLRFINKNIKYDDLYLDN